MAELGERVRRARALARISQEDLARAVGVHRSAVAQWESRDGSLPSMRHLILIATATGVCLEWLGTGRGPVRPDEDAWTPATLAGDYAQDELESECLSALRAIPFQTRRQIVSLVGLVAKGLATGRDPFAA